jgi:hypothetical protein
MHILLGLIPNKLWEKAPTPYRDSIVVGEDPELL